MEAIEAAAAVDEADQLIGLLTEAPEWDLPTRCAGWALGDLARHVAQSSALLTEGVERMLAGETVGADRPPSLEGNREMILDALSSGVRRMEKTFSGLAAEHMPRPCPYFFGTVPTESALTICAFEFGGHRSDVAHALGKEDSLPEAVARAALWLLPSMADEVPDQAVAFSFRGTTLRADASVRDGAWIMEEDCSVPTCTISGDDSSIALFAAGRLRSDDDRLRLSGATELASRFKTWFPGP